MSQPRKASIVLAIDWIGETLATVRSGEVEASPKQVQEALRDVIAHNIYGVDSNPTAVELCREKSLSPANFSVLLFSVKKAVRSLLVEP